MQEPKLEQTKVKPKRKLTEEHKRKIGLANKGKKKPSLSLRMTGKGHPLWKGDKIGYRALHAWARRHKPKPLFCEQCHQNKPYDLANVSGEYRRDISDFIWICRKCHMETDGRMEQFRKIFIERNKLGITVPYDGVSKYCWRG